MLRQHFRHCMRSLPACFDSTLQAARTISAVVTPRLTVRSLRFVTNIHRRAALQASPHSRPIGIARIGRQRKVARIGVIRRRHCRRLNRHAFARAGHRSRCWSGRRRRPVATGKSFAWITRGPWILTTSSCASGVSPPTGDWTPTQARHRLGWLIRLGGRCSRSKDVNALAATMAAGPDAVRVIDAAGLKRISPCIEPGQVAAAFYSGVDGHLDPVYATAALPCACPDARRAYPLPM